MNDCSTFIEECIKYGIASEKGNANIINKKTEVIEKIICEWRTKDVFLVETLYPMLNHEEDYVRLKAAYYLIPYLPEKAKAVLVDLSLRERCQLGFEAEMILYVWESGELKF